MIIIISGDIGSGKTLTLTYYLLKKLAQGFTVYTNYELKNLPKDYARRVIRITKEMVGDLDYWRGVKHEKVCIAIDEIHNLLDSRRGMVGKQVKITHWVAQIRKCLKGNRNNHLFCTTQYLHQVDRRLRSLARHHIHCESDEHDMAPVVLEHYRKDSRTEDGWFYVREQVIRAGLKRRVFRYYDTYELVDEWD